MSVATAPRYAARPALAGFATLLGFALRRERVRLPVTVLAIAVLEALMAGSHVALYPTVADRVGYLATVNNPGTTFLVGPPYPGFVGTTRDYDFGVLTGHQTLLWITICLAVVAALTMVRHTRAEEESERAELVHSAPVARFAPLAVAVTVTLLLVTATCVGGFLVLVGLRESTVDASGAAVYSAAAGTVAMVYAAVAAVAAQLVRTARAASGLTTLVLTGSFLVRGAADVAGSDLGAVTPFGWGQRTYPWDGNHWVWLGLPVVVAALLLGLAALLMTRRDVGAAPGAVRPGRRVATRALLTAPGLAARLNRGNVLGWCLGLAIFGLVYGPVLSDAERFLRDMPILGEFAPEAAVSGGMRLFAGIVVAIGALAVTVPSTQVVTRFVKDESAGRTAPLVAGPVSRTTWYVASVLVALLTATVALLIFSSAFAVSAGGSVDEPGLNGGIVRAGVCYLPAVAVVIGLAAALAGWRPQWTWLAWLVLVWSVLEFYFGELLSWPEPVRWLSPFSHVSTRPAVADDTVALLVLSLLALGLTGLGWVGYRRRAVG